MNRHKPPEIDTSMPSWAERSSTSSASATTRESESCITSESEAEEEDDHADVEEIIPKVEEVDDLSLQDTRTSIETEETENKLHNPSTQSQETKKRRGRPRKNPIISPVTQQKIAKGRSKTGCITCRRRKKKCDEARPSCNNCQKNAVICEGYPPREIWRGGKARSEEVSTARTLSVTVPRGVPFLIDGIETEIDRRFLDHYVFDLSKVLTLHDHGSNPFKDLLLPIAVHHKGLMHSLMALSGTHIISRHPEPATNERQLHHLDAAVTTLHADIAAAGRGGKEHGLRVDDPTMAMTLLQCLMSICSGSTNGEYRMHMDGARLLLPNHVSSSPEFQQFVMEFYQYHDVSNALTSLDRRPLKFDADDRSTPKFVINPAKRPGTDAFVGVTDGLFKFINQITALRDNIRDRKVKGVKPVVDYQMLSQAVAIDAGIRHWETAAEPQSLRWIVAQLYRQCTWVYLFRSTQASKPSQKIQQAVDDGLAYLRAMPPDEPPQSIMLQPVFILGCAAFEQRQRDDLEVAFDNLQAYSNFGNIKPARRIVKKVWDMMDAGDERSWDWESIIGEMDMDFLIT